MILQKNMIKHIWIVSISLITLQKILEADCTLTGELKHTLIGVDFDAECFIESKIWQGEYYTLQKDTETCNIYVNNTRVCNIYRGPAGLASCISSLRDTYT